MELVARRICQRFDAVTALDDVGLHVADGEVLAVIGPSGCGKSTLLAVLGGLLAPTSGEVALAGQKPPGCLCEIAYVFQDFNLLPWRTAEQNVRLPLEHHAMPARERQARGGRRAGADRAVGVPPRAAAPTLGRNAPAGRASPAPSPCARPSCCWTSRCRRWTRRTRDLLMEDFLRIWARDRTTAVYVTHNLAEALRLADRIAVFTRRPGRIREMVSVDVPRAERDTPAGRARLTELQDRLWGAIRAEALIADREPRACLRSPKPPGNARSGSARAVLSCSAARPPPPSPSWRSSWRGRLRCAVAW